MPVYRDWYRDHVRGTAFIARLGRLHTLGLSR